MSGSFCDVENLPEIMAKRLLTDFMEATEPSSTSKSF